MKTLETGSIALRVLGLGTAWSRVVSFTPPCITVQEAGIGLRAGLDCADETSLSVGGNLDSTLLSWSCRM
jgi:hypothetical protein